MAHDFHKRIAADLLVARMSTIKANNLSEVPSVAEIAKDFNFLYQKVKQTDGPKKVGTAPNKDQPIEAVEAIAVTGRPDYTV
jgi:hypothetical protein